MALQVGPAGIVVLAPSRYPAGRIEDVIRSRAGWLRRHLERIEANRPTPLCHGATLFLRGEAVALEVEIDALRVRPSVAEGAGVLHVHLPSRMCEGGAAVLGPLLRAHARKLAERELPERLAGFARALGRSAPRVLIREQKRRWGSCAQDGTIRLNWRLILLPPALADYVCAHEAAHLLVMDHSPRFWAVVERLVPAWRPRRAELRRDAGAYLRLD